MTFEEKLSQMYNKIANEISDMIPVEWEKVYAIAYVDDGGGQVKSLMIYGWNFIDHLKN